MIFSRVPQRALHVFTLQLSTMLKARVPLNKSLNMLVADQRNKLFKSVLHRIRSGVEEGQSLYQMMSKFPSIFSGFYQQMVLVGEQTGKIPEMLNRVDDYLRKQEDIKQKLTQAMTYPSVIFVVSLIAIIFLMVFVIPEFESIFRDHAKQLPGITLMVIAVSQFFVDYTGLIILLILTLSVMLTLMYRNTKGFQILSIGMLKIPIIGTFIKDVFIARICLILSVLLEAKISLIHALEITQQSIHNAAIENEIKKMKRVTTRGESIADALKHSTLFPPIVTHMLSVGEETANVHQMFQTISDYYQEELDRSLTRMTSLLEPAIIIMLGLFIGFIVIAIYLPMFELSNMI